MAQVQDQPGPQYEILFNGGGEKREMKKGGKREERGGREEEEERKNRAHECIKMKLRF